MPYLFPLLAALEIIRCLPRENIMRSTSATVREQGIPANANVSSGTAPEMGHTEPATAGTEPGGSTPTTAKTVPPKQGGRVPKKKDPVDRSAHAAKKVNAAKLPATVTQETTTNVAVSLNSQFNQTIIIPAALDALFGMSAEERVAEVKRVCERDEVEALNTYVAPLTRWLNDLDYVLDNYADVVDALEDHFNNRARILQIRREGVSLGKIAAMTGYNKSTVHLAVSAGGVAP